MAVRSENVVQEKVRRFFVCSHGAGNPTDTEWDALIADYMEWPKDEEVRVIVTSEGGAPTPAQRARLTAAMKQRPIRVALITESRIIRAIGVAISWFNPRQRMFAPANTSAALSFLEANVLEQKEIGEKIAELHAQWRAKVTARVG